MWFTSITTFLQSPENKEIASSLIPLIITAIFFLIGFLVFCVMVAVRLLFQGNDQDGAMDPPDANPSPETIQIVLNSKSRVRTYFRRIFSSFGSKEPSHLAEVDLLNNKIQWLELECAKLREQNASLLSRLATKECEMRHLQAKDSSAAAVEAANERLLKAQQRTHQVENQLSELITFVDKLYQNRTEPEEIKRMKVGLGQHV